MVNITGLTQSIPKASEDILHQIINHARVVSYKVISCDDMGLVVECNWKVMLGSRDVENEVSGKGVRSIEPVYWHILFNFPESPIFPSLRRDFPRSQFPHIYPSKLGDIVRPCITESDIISFMLANGMVSLLVQLDSWLDKAAQDTLMLEEQGWEPIIFENWGGSFTDVGSILLRGAEQEVTQQATTGKMSEMKGAFTILEGERTKHIIASNDKAMGAQESVTIINVFFPESSTTQEFQNLPVENRQDLLALATALEGEPLLPQGQIVFAEPELTMSEHIKLHLDKLDNIQAKTKGSSSVKACIVIVYIPRPYELIGGYSKIEVVPFFVRTVASSCANPEVIPLSYIRGGSQDVLQKISHHHPRPIKHISFLGVGSVGSKIALSLAKGGSYQPHVIDKSIFRPHNLARHGLSSIGNGEGWPKAALLKMAIENSGVPASCSFADLGRGEIALPAETDVIIESTGNELVSLNLANQGQLNGRIYQVGLYGCSTMGYLAIEPASKERQVRIDDIEAMLYGLSLDNEVINRALYETKGAERQFVGHGCSSETTIIPDTALNLVCASLTEKIDNSIYAKQAHKSQGELHLCFKGDDSSIKSESLIIPPTDVQGFSHDNRFWEVRISSLVSKTMFNERQNALPNETGGAILGHICEFTNRIYVTRTIQLPHPIVQSSAEFSINQQQLHTLDEHVRGVTAGRVYVLGTWHSHTVPSNPSILDKQTLDTLCENFNLPVVTMLMCDGEGVKIVEHQKNEDK
jgi:hypothetical protein